MEEFLFLGGIAAKFQMKISGFWEMLDYRHELSSFLVGTCYILSCE